jgi:hypothetical protein
VRRFTETTTVALQTVLKRIFASFDDVELMRQTDIIRGILYRL